jgi:hypothetical protein
MKRGIKPHFLRHLPSLIFPLLLINKKRTITCPLLVVPRFTWIAVLDERIGAKKKFPEGNSLFFVFDYCECLGD